MKILIVIFLAFNTFSQESQFLRFGVDYNLNVYAPYTSNETNHVKSSNKITSNNWFGTFDYCIYNKKKFSFYTGINYKKINYKLINHINTFTYSYHSGSNPIPIDVIHEYQDPADLIAKSNSLGLSIEVDYSMFQKERISMSLGFKSTIFFLEWYKAYYFSTDILIGGNTTDPDGLDYNGPKPLISELPRNFFLSSINSALIYRIMWIPENKRHVLTGKVSLGVNIFSDWEQFKRYAWLGIGLEVGFLGKK